MPHVGEGSSFSYPSSFQPPQPRDGKVDVILRRFLRLLVERMQHMNGVDQISDINHAISASRSRIRISRTPTPIVVIGFQSLGLRPICTWYSS